MLNTVSTMRPRRPAGVNLRLQHFQTRAFLFELMHKVQLLGADDRVIGVYLALGQETRNGF
jgi:hypothetical protein